jgi:hypothetical protein
MLHSDCTQRLNKAWVPVIIAVVTKPQLDGPLVDCHVSL